MKIITVLIMITVILSLLLVNAEDDEYCTNLISQCNRDFTTNCQHHKYIIKNCCNLKIFSSPTGVYKIRKEQFNTADVYCDMDTDDGGWIVIQRNKKSSEQSFNQHFKSYEIGFGNLTKDFWYGLKGINCLTQTGQWEMRLDILDNDKKKSFFHYNNFKVGTAEEGYPLMIGGYTQRGTDYFAALNGRKFSAPNTGKDNDQVSSSHCAAIQKAGWWYYNTCNVPNINRQPPVIYPDVVLQTEMKIRPKDCISL